MVYDEAQELTDDQVEAIMATLAASATGTRQLIYTGTPPYPGCPGDVFRRRRTACLDAPGAHDAWHEWSVEGNRWTGSTWKTTRSGTDQPGHGHPAQRGVRGGGVPEHERRRFARERLGWWSPVLTEQSDKALDAGRGRTAPATRKSRRARRPMA